MADLVVAAYRVGQVVSFGFVAHKEGVVVVQVAQEARRVHDLVVRLGEEAAVRKETRIVEVVLQHFLEGVLVHRDHWGNQD